MKIQHQNKTLKQFSQSLRYRDSSGLYYYLVTVIKADCLIFYYFTLTLLHATKLGEGLVVAQGLRSMLQYMYSVPMIQIDFILNHA